MSEGEKIKCRICGAQVHIMQMHLKEEHPSVTVEQYRADHSDAPMLSPEAIARLEKKKQAEKIAMAGAAAATVTTLADHRTGPVAQPLHELFGFGSAPAARNTRGDPIMVRVHEAPEDLRDFVPAVDDGYVFDINLTKTVLMALEVNKTLYLWGHSGTGKSSVVKSVCAKVGRPMIRVQHTANTEEMHILGQWVARGGETLFQLGPLPFAMKHGLVYMADEYDFALPSVLSVYQAVLEGEPLVIKEADPENRIIRPHPNFRFVGTGNTNGVGDETGLYQGTVMQNAANYERFSVVEEVQYMDEGREIAVVMNKAGILKKDAEKIVRFANDIRREYAGNKISLPMSPRASINAAQIGMMKNDFKAGIQLAYANRLSRVDKATVMGFAQRIWG